MALLAACTATDFAVTENTPTRVTVRYDGVGHSLSDATATARRICATYGRTAQLRENQMRTILLRFAHFDCV